MNYRGGPDKERRSIDKATTACHPMQKLDSHNNPTAGG